MYNVYLHFWLTIPSTLENKNIPDAVLQIILALL